MLRLIFSVTLFGILLMGCSKSSLEKLASDTVYLELNNSFWASEHKNKSELWKDAFSYCKKARNKPNCAPVLMEYAFTNGSTSAPPIGHSGHEIDVPNF